jgi:cardiolipin synthase
VLDGGVAFIGPFDPARTTADAADAPHAVVVEGPAVAELQWLFIDGWRQHSLGPLQSGRYFPALPWIGAQRVGIALADHDGDRAAYARTLLAAVDAAQDRVLLVTNTRPDGALREALAAACSRGVDVHLLGWGATARHGLGAPNARWEPLLSAGVHVHEIQDGAPRAHANVIDGVWSSIEAAGATACSGACGHDHLIVLDAGFGAQGEVAFWSDVARASAVAPAMQAPGPLQRLNARLARYLEVSP